MPMELKYFLSENKNEAIIELWEDNKLGYFVCDAATLEGLIRGLAQIRRNMSEQVSPELDPCLELRLKLSLRGWCLIRTTRPFQERCCASATPASDG